MVLAMLLFAAAQAPMRLIEAADPMTGRPTVHVMIGYQKYFLAVGCDGAQNYKPEVVVQFERRIGDSRPGLLMGGREMIYRLDDDKPEIVRWYTWKNQVLAGQAPTRASPFIKALMHSRRAAFRIATKDGRRLDIGLEYDSPTKLIQQAMEKCGVTLP